MNCRSRPCAYGDWQTRHRRKRKWRSYHWRPGQLFSCLRFSREARRGDEFVELFNKFDCGDTNPFHRSRAQVKDGVRCRDTADPDHFYLIGEWADIEEHRRIREL